MKKRTKFFSIATGLLIAIACLFTAILPQRTASAAEESAAYTLQFNGGDGSPAITGAAELPTGSGAVTYEFDVEDFSIDASNNYMVGFLTATPENIQSVYPYNRKGSFMTFVRRDHPSLVQAAGDSGFTCETSGKFTLTDLFKAGNSVKVVYEPYVSESEKGSLTLYTKATGAETYTEMGKVYNVGEDYAPTGVALYLIVYGKAELTVSNYKQYASDGTELALGATWASSPSTMLVKKAGKATGYDVSMVSGAGYFGSANGADLTGGKTLSLEFDVTYAVMPIANYNVGAVASSTDTSLAYPYTADKSLFLYGNYYLPNHTPYLLANKGTATDKGTVSGALNPVSLIAQDKTVKIVYTPYVEGVQSAKLEIFQKNSADGADKYALVTAATEIDPTVCPSITDVKLYVFFGVPNNYAELKFGIDHFKVTAGDSEIKGMSKHSGMAITKAVAENPAITRAVFDFKTSGYFASGSAYSTANGAEIAIEMDVIESYTKTANTWVGFALGSGAGKYMYAGENGALMYYKGGSAAGVNAEVSNGGNVGYLEIFRAGKTVKGVLDTETKTFSVYQKTIGAAAYGDPVTTFTLTGTLPTNAFFGICVQNGFYMEVANLSYLVDGVAQKVTLGSDAAFTTKDIDVVDRHAEIVANKTSSGAGYAALTYATKLDKSAKVRFVSEGEQALSLFVSESAEELASAVKLSVSLGVGAYEVGFADGKLSLSQGGAEIASVEYGYTSFYFGFMTESETAFAKKAMIDDFAVTFSDGTEENHDFNLGLSSAFVTSVSSKRSLVKVGFSYYTVTYYYVDGSVAGVYKVGLNGNAVAPDGEYKNADYVNRVSKNVQNDLSVLLVRTTDEIERFVVTAAGGKFADGTDIQLVKSGTALTLTADAPEAGYYFAGWYVNGALASEEATYAFTATLAADYEAKFEKYVYELTAVGGTVSAATATYGEEVTFVADEAAVGAYFVGWYDGELLISDKISFTYGVTGSVTFTAKFNLYSYTVTAVNGKANGTSAASVEYGATVTLTADTAATGYAFVGWYLDDVKVSEEATYQATVTGDVVYLAKFAKLRYTVTAVGGTVNGEASASALYEDTVALSAEKKDGYVFVGWYEGENLVATDEAYSYTVTKDVTLTAKFEEVKEEGCGSVSGGAAALFALVGVAFVCKKRRED